MADAPIAPSFVSGMTCMICGRALPPEHLDRGYVCPHHPDRPDEGILDISYDYAAAGAFFPGGDRSDPGGAGPDFRSLPGMWRYRAVLPLPPDAPVPPLLTGMTPLYEAPALARSCKAARVLIKDDTRQPTASFKDRASALAVALAMDRRAPAVAAASTGNAAAALAGMAASVGMPCVLFVPASAPSAKVAQLTACGARVLLVRGSYDQAFGLCQEACRRQGWYNRNTAFNPCMAEGKKTAAFEIVEQSGWSVPDAVFVGVGDGCILAGLHKGFADLIRLGRTDRMPRLYGVQAAGSDFLWQAQQEGRFTPDDLLSMPPIKARTAADSLSAGLPRDRLKAMRAARETGGSFLRVDDADILAAVPDLARNSGVFAEPAGAACLAGLRAAIAAGMVAPSETVCLVATGSGLKDIDALEAAPRAFPPAVISPDSAGLDAALDAVAATLQPQKASRT